MSENSDNADQGDQQEKSTKFLSKMALRLKSLLKDLLKAFVRKLHSLTRNYMFVSQVLSQEKKLLKVRSIIRCNSVLEINLIIFPINS